MKARRVAVVGGEGRVKSLRTLRTVWEPAEGALYGVMSPLLPLICSSYCPN